MHRFFQIQRISLTIRSECPLSASWVLFHLYFELLLVCGLARAHVNRRFKQPHIDSVGKLGSIENRQEPV